MNINYNLYKKEGFVVIKNIIPKTKIVNLKKTFNLLSQKFLGIDYINNEKKFLKKYISTRKTNPKLTGHLYDSLTTSFSLQNLILDKDIQLQIKNVMNEKLENLSHFFRCLRVDTPQENPNELDWHQDVQDISFSKTDQIDGLTLWAPITEANLQQGTMEMCISSHFKKINNIKFLERKKFQSKYVGIPNKFSNIYKKIKINARPGDCVLMNMNTLHRSITSSSPQAKLRLTVIARFFKFSSRNFVAGSQRFVASKP
jgi:ectoine hydroxylase-related dioxygenase (phytanoyl-CoA dioxygenase family)